MLTTFKNSHFQTRPHYQQKCLARSLRDKLSPVGNKTTIANRLYQFLHPAVSSNIMLTGVEPPPTGVTINVPWQIMEQLSSFFQQFNNAISITSADTAGNNLPSSGYTLRDIDESLLVASDQPLAPISQCLHNKQPSHNSYSIHI